MQGAFIKNAIMSRESKQGGFVDAAGGGRYNEKVWLTDTIPGR